MGEVAGGAAGELNTTVMTPGADHGSQQSAGASPLPSYSDLCSLTHSSSGHDLVPSNAGASPQPSLTDINMLSQSGCLAAGASASSSLISLPGISMPSTSLNGQGEVKLEVVIPGNGDYIKSGLMIPGIGDFNKPGTIIPDIRLPMLDTTSDTNSMVLPGPSTPMLLPKSETGSMLQVLPGMDAKSETASFLPICRICHNPDDENEILISPCRCSGTMQYIHDTCLMVSSDFI